MTIAHVNHQGYSSHTLICLERNPVIRFRAAKLNLEAIDETKQICGDFMTTTTHLDDFVLPVYT